MTNETNIVVPDIGGAKNVDVIDILVKKGDLITKEQSLVTLEGDKATMEIPSPQAGTVQEIKIKLGDKVSQGSVILTLNTNGQADPAVVAVTPPAKKEPVASTPEVGTALPQHETTDDDHKNQLVTNISKPITPPTLSPVANETILAGPAVRRLARDFGVDLSAVIGSGRKSRISLHDLQTYVKTKVTEAPSFGLPKTEPIDFSVYGPIDIKPLNKIKRMTATNLHRSWITVPHVTQFDEADMTDLEAFRRMQNEQASTQGYKLTLVAFITKILAHQLMVFPQFNASLDPSGENLIYKQYINIGIAVETPNGLVVPVIKNVPQLSVAEIAKAITQISQKAREKGLTPAEMSGGTFTISSLGGIGGTAFTPIVNAPEVAILGLSRASMKPVFDGTGFQPRLILPLSLSYDHRVIDGAEAARFTQGLVEKIQDIRKIL